MTYKQLKRITTLRHMLNNSAKPLGDLELLRQVVDELMLILLDQATDKYMYGLGQQEDD